MALTIYGIKTCDTIKKARAWLDAQRIAYRFHDYRSDGIDAVRLKGWAAQVGWETLLNKAGTTFRALPEVDRQSVDAAKAIALMQAYPVMIKRPVLERSDGALLVGFKPDAYEKFFS